MSSRNNKPGPDSVRAETITPRIGSAMLKNGAPNRSIRPELVEQYATDMKNGRWALNGETLKINRSGAVIDGQHRLLACIKCGCAFKTYVARGIDEKQAIHSIDVGASRTPADFLSFHKMPNAKNIAAVARVFHDIADAQPRKSPGYRLRAPETLKSRAVLLDYLKKRPQILESTALLGEHRAELAGWVPLSVVAAIHAFCSLIAGKEAATEFIVPLADGANLDRTTIVYKLRQRLQKEARKVGLKVTSKAKLCLILRGWNRFITGAPAAKLPLTASAGTPLLIPRVLKQGDKLADGGHTRRAVTRDERKRKQRGAR